MLSFVTIIDSSAFLEVTSSSELFCYCFLLIYEMLNLNILWKWGFVKTFAKSEGEHNTKL